jgi:hypothetical protein
MHSQDRKIILAAGAHFFPMAVRYYTQLFQRGGLQSPPDRKKKIGLAEKNG